MQTFLPYDKFGQSAAVLDNKRLGKQRVECKQILNAIVNGGGWARHPAVRMWRGYETALLMYYRAVILEWTKRGFRHSMKLGELEPRFRNRVVRYPPWLGFPQFHNSHKSNLVRKNPTLYRVEWPDVTDQLPYFWPVNKDGSFHFLLAEYLDIHGTFRP